MKALRRFLLLLACLLAPPSLAQPRDALAGLYVLDMRETASALELSADGRFVWFFTTGALDLVGRGRWRRDGDSALVLDNDPPYGAPRFELVETAPSDRPGTLVRVDRTSRAYVSVLDVEGEFSDGSRQREPLGSGGARLTAPEGRRLVAVRLGSLAFGFQSEPFAVDGDRVMTFRFLPNQIGRQDFAATRVAVEPDALSFDWRGVPLRYGRVADAPAGSLAAELAEMIAAAENGPPPEPQGDAAGGEPVDYAPSQPWETSEATPSLGRIDLGLGERLAETASRSTFAFRDPADLGHGFADGVAELGIRSGERSYDFGRVTSLTWNVRDDGGDGPAIATIGFSHQDRMLDLAEMLARARALQSWLAAAGFTVGAQEDADATPFRFVHPYRYDERAGGWDEAAAVLADEEAGLLGMDLYFMRGGEWFATVRTMNLDRAGSGRRAFENGREWTLEVEFHRPFELLTPEIVDVEDVEE